MSTTVTLDTSGFTLSLQRFVTLTGADAEKAALRYSRVFMRYVIAITPPGDGKQGGQRAALTKEDEYRARRAIEADLARLFIPVRLKGKRAEQWPDVAGLHSRAFFAGKTPGKAIKKMGPAKYVDERKVKALQRDLFSRVGKLAAHWLAGALAIATTGIPQWVKRHGPRGRHELTQPGAPVYRFTALNTGVPDKILGELDRRMGYAAGYTSRQMNDALAAILARRAEQFNRAA